MKIVFFLNPPDVEPIRVTMDWRALIMPRKGEDIDCDFFEGLQCDLSKEDKELISEFSWTITSIEWKSEKGITFPEINLEWMV